MLNIRYRVLLAVSLFDTVSGVNIFEKAKFTADGNVPINAIGKGAGVYVFTDLLPGHLKLTVKAYGFEPLTFEVDVEPDGKMIDRLLYLMPDEYYTGDRPFRRFEGCKRGLTSIEAVRLNRETCRYRETDERKRIITVYDQRGKDFLETPYAIISDRDMTYERLDIIKNIGGGKIKVQTVPEKEYSVGDRINRICFGRVDEEGNYSLVLADEGNEKYIVKTCDEEGEHFAFLDFRLADDFKL
ncbi:MAG: carboxypeptidase-like regulatory domain-containing protein [Clostridia bacterium]|nr:carboxypeptidase-like regulatory domain-containing protein [Clostridia bacterium]